MVAPALPGMDDPNADPTASPSDPTDPTATPDDGAAPGAPSPEQELLDAAKAIVMIKAVGNRFLITLGDGQEITLAPGDAHVVGPVDRSTVFDPGDGGDMGNLHEMFHTGQLPASLHQMIQGPDQPTAAEAGLIQPPGPVLPGMGPPPPTMGGPPPAMGQPPQGKPPGPALPGMA